MLNFQREILWAREWENLIVADVKLSKWDFYFYCHILHKISVVNSKFRNDTANILCSVLNSLLLKPTILKFSFMFIEFRYNLSIRVTLCIGLYLYRQNNRWIYRLKWKITYFTGKFTTVLLKNYLLLNFFCIYSRFFWFQGGRTLGYVT